MTDKHGMLRNGSIDSVGRDSNSTDSTTATASAAAEATTTTTIATAAAATVTTTATAIIAAATVNANSPNNDGNNNENASPSNNGGCTVNSSQNDRQSHSNSNSPIDTENGNSSTSTTATTTAAAATTTITPTAATDQSSVNSGGSGGGGGNDSGCASNGNYSTATGNGSNANNNKQPNHSNNSTNYTNSNNGSPLHNPCGGRLQFFKDGKFILELARSKEGDRGWISVPRKTYWPPAAALSQNNLNNHKNESSTSLSFSDDNSSIQSSPWQRDHNWKQLSPRKNLSKDLNFYYYRPMALVLNDKSKRVSKYLRRRPLHVGGGGGDSRKNQTTINHSVQYTKRLISKTPSPKIKLERNESNDSSSSGNSNSCNDDVSSMKPSKKTTKDKNNSKKDQHPHSTITSSTTEDIVDSPNVKSERNTSDVDGDEKMDCTMSDECNSKSVPTSTKLAKDDIKSINLPPRQRIKPIINWKRQMRQRSKIGSVIEKLIARVADNPINVTATQIGLGLHFSAAAAGGTAVTTSRATDLFSPHQHLSPRKRMLKDFTEKVSLEDRGSTSTQKRLRSKSNASTIGDFANSGGGSGSGNTKSPGTNYSIVVAQHTANIACTDKDLPTHRIANGSPPRSSEKSSRTSSASMSVASLTSSSFPSTSSTAVKGTNHSHASINEVSSSQPISKPISNYSIKSLLGHNNSSNSHNHNNDGRTEINLDIDRMNAESRGSPRSPMSYNNNHHYPHHHPHQIISSSTSAAAAATAGSSGGRSASSYVPKKKSPTNALINSPTHYRNARSPDINSPSPGPIATQSNNSRYHSAAAAASSSLSSPTPSSFHPYLSSSRGSPLSSSGTLSPTDIYRHRSYRMAAASPSNSSISGGGLTHNPYASLNGSPTAFAASSSNRYSPMSSNHSSSTKTSPNSDRSSVTMTQSHQHPGLSMAYNVSNLLPQSYDLNELHRQQQQLSPPNAKQRSIIDWSPARPPPTSSGSGHGSPTNYTTNNNSNSNNHNSNSSSSTTATTATTTTTIPKKTALFRQKYGSQSLSPNGYAYGVNNIGGSENNNAAAAAASSSPSSTTSSSSAKGGDPSKNKQLSNSDSGVGFANKRPKSPPPLLLDSQRSNRPTQQDYEKEMQARYNAEVAAMHHHQSLIASALQQQAAAAANPWMALPPSMAAAAAAAYINPLYYHPSAGDMFRKTHSTAQAQMDLLHKNLVHPSSWMDPYSAASLMQHYPAIAADKATLMAKSQTHEVLSPTSPYVNLTGRPILGARDQSGANASAAVDIEMWNVADAKKSPITSPTSATPSAFRRHPQQFSDCEPISLIKDEPSSDVPLNLSKH